MYIDLEQPTGTVQYTSLLSPLFESITLLFFFLISFDLVSNLGSKMRKKSAFKDYLQHLCRVQDVADPMELARPRPLSKLLSPPYSETLCDTHLLNSLLLSELKKKKDIFPPSHSSQKRLQE